MMQEPRFVLLFRLLSMYIRSSSPLLLLIIAHEVCVCVGGC